MKPRMMSPAAASKLRIQSLDALESAQFSATTKDYRRAILQAKHAIGIMETLAAYEAQLAPKYRMKKEPRIFNNKKQSK